MKKGNRKSRKKGNHKSNQTLYPKRQRVSDASHGSGKLGPTILVEDIQAFIDRTIKEKQTPAHKKHSTSLVGTTSRKSRKK